MTDSRIEYVDYDRREGTCEVSVPVDESVPERDRRVHVKSLICKSAALAVTGISGEWARHLGRLMVYGGEMLEGCILSSAAHRARLAGFDVFPTAIVVPARQDMNFIAEQFRQPVVLRIHWRVLELPERWFLPKP